MRGCEQSIDHPKLVLFPRHQIHLLSRGVFYILRDVFFLKPVRANL